MPKPARSGRAAAAEAGEDLRVPGPGGGRLCGRRHSRVRLCRPHGRTGRHLLQGKFARKRKLARLNVIKMLLSSRSLNLCT